LASGRRGRRFKSGVLGGGLGWFACEEGSW
jgi:hypothetical protein